MKYWLDNIACFYCICIRTCSNRRQIIIISQILSRCSSKEVYFRSSRRTQNLIDDSCIVFFMCFIVYIQCQRLENVNTSFYYAIFASCGVVFDVVVDRCSSCHIQNMFILHDSLHIVLCDSFKRIISFTVEFDKFYTKFTKLEKTFIFTHYLIFKHQTMTDKQSNKLSVVLLTFFYCMTNNRSLNECLSNTASHVKQTMIVCKTCFNCLLLNITIFKIWIVQILTKFCNKIVDIHEFSFICFGLIVQIYKNF